MKIKMFQVICMDRTGFIEEYHNFTPNQTRHMMQFIEDRLQFPKMNKIEITRWNEKGERE